VNNIIVTAALKSETRLRNLYSLIPKQHTQKFNLKTLDRQQLIDLNCSDIVKKDSSKKMISTLNGKTNKIRKRQILARLIFITATQVVSYFFCKKNTNTGRHHDSYLVYPSLANPTFLLFFSDKALTSNLPLIFSSNQIIHKAHLLMLLALDRFSNSNRDRDRAILRTGIGLAHFCETKHKGQGERKLEYRSVLVMVTSQKYIHFFSERDDKISNVVIWDKKNMRIQPDHQYESPFEECLYKGVVGGRKLKVIPYYEGESTKYSSGSFIKVLNKILLIQKTLPLPIGGMYSIDLTFNTLKKNLIRLGLSKSQFQYVSDQVISISLSRNDMFELKYQHGDFVPRNIISNRNGELSIIDNSDDVGVGFFLTDISTLILSILAGEPNKSNPDKIAGMLYSNQFLKMKNQVKSLLILSEEELITGLMIGLVERLRVCEIEARQDVTNYWMQVVKIFLQYFLTYDKMKA
jgi:hypothetical protein